MKGPLVRNAIFFSIFLLIQVQIDPIEGKGQYVMPVLLGMKMSLPYDAANVFIRPNAGILSTFLAGSLAFILFFGVITSPFGYMFGIPSRKYILGSEADLLHSQSTALSPRTISRNFSPLDQLLWVIPDSTDDDSDSCQLLSLCLSHSFLKHLSVDILKIYRASTQSTVQNIPKSHREAILLGITNQGSKCTEFYPKCQETPFTLAVKAYMNLLPLPDNIRNGEFRKRKQEMYM